MIDETAQRARLASQLLDVEQALRETRSPDVRALLRSMRTSLRERLERVRQDGAVELVPAASFTTAQLAEIFTDAYEGYFMPVRIDEATFAAMGSSWDYDLDASRVALGPSGTPVGLAMLGRRGDEGWVGGVGVYRAHRGAGIGRLLMDGLAGEAAARGVRRLWLEVLVQNETAIALYERLGYEHVRELEVWSLDELPVRREGATEVPAAEAQERIAGARTEREPWQRADATVANAAEVRGLASPRAAALYRLADGRVTLLQAVAEDESAARELLCCLPSEAASLSWLNGPAGDPFNRAIDSLGGILTARQHEMLLDL